MKLALGVASLALALVPLLVACGGADASSNDAASTDEAPLTGVHMIGNLDDRSVGRVTIDGGDGANRGLSFRGVAGDEIDVWVRADVGSVKVGGDPVAWLLTASGLTLAFNDNASSGTFDSHLHATLATTGDYVVVFRDNNAARVTPTNVEVSLTVGCSTVNQIASEPCGRGGTREKLCLATSPPSPNRWTDWSVCAGEVSTGCATWTCTPGAVDTTPAGCATPGTVRRRTCNSACAWGSFSATCTP